MTLDYVDQLTVHLYRKLDFIFQKIGYCSPENSTILPRDGPEIGQLQTEPVSGWYLETRKAQRCFNVSRLFQQDLKSNPPILESLYGTDQDIRWGWGPSLLVLPDRSTKECPVLANAQMPKCPNVQYQPIVNRLSQGHQQATQSVLIVVCETCH